MPIDPIKALGAALPLDDAAWTEDQVILYHLGLGAGVPPTDPRELRYVYEGDLHVLPSFAVIPLFQGLSTLEGVEGVDVDPAMVLHGEHDLELRRAIPVAATARNTGRVAGVYDKGSGALLVIEAETTDENGDLMFVNRMSLFVRGEGGFGGEPAPRTGNTPPERAPDHVVESATLPQQALIYRLSGDRNPLHADPAFAAKGGFDRPILHGMCTYGLACKAVVDTVLDGNVGAVTRYQARFSGVVYPGETIVTSMWVEADRVVMQCDAKERGAAAITNAAVFLQ